MEANGIHTPLQITKDNVIICGHNRWKVSMELKLDAIPCIYVEGSTDDHVCIMISENLIRRTVTIYFAKLNKL
ncbi:ParB N-terminal domain-containing protein [Alkalihalobacterium alkalinitrilicum]|uniref:ParB N-terminal domain-containing protein n=1 Tax=Alkalihalobacterium alkalinitrilicum TaxID=427920 RepID=UPI0009956E06